MLTEIRLDFSIGLSGSEFVCTWTFESTLAERRDIAVPLSELQWRDARGEQRLSGAEGTVTLRCLHRTKDHEAVSTLGRHSRDFRDSPPGRLKPRVQLELERLASVGKLYGHWKQQEAVAQGIAERRTSRRGRA